jgi:uncharacterized protein (TIGR03437 family)
VIAQNGTIYVGSYDYNLYAINSDGTLQWKFPTSGEITSSPVIGSDGTIYVGSSDNYFYAIKPDGMLKWKNHNWDNVDSSPAIASDGAIYFCSEDEGAAFKAINPDGAIKWSRSIGGWGITTSSPAIADDGTIYIGSTDRRLYALNPNGSTKWTFEADDEIHSSPALGPDGTILISTRRGTLYAVNPQGQQKWVFQRGLSAVTIGRDGTIHVGAEYALTPEGKIKWESGLWSSSSAAIGKDGTLYAGVSRIGGSFVVAVSPATVYAVSAASFLGAELAIESIVAAFGSNLATTTQIATTVPLPTSLAGTRVKVRDRGDTEHDAPLFFVSPTQVNFQMPSAWEGPATVIITSGNGVISGGIVNITRLAPGLFTANASGQGLPAGYVLRVRGGAQSDEPIAPSIDLGPVGDQVYLILFATGIRYRSSLANVTATIGGTPVGVPYAGPAPGFVGLDQVNLGPLPRSLAGRGEVDVALRVDGKQANTMRVNVK